MVKEAIQNGNSIIVPPSGIDRGRLAFAISAGKLVGATGRLLRVSGGTSLPGMVARRIDPNILKSVIGASKAKKIVITGSNGKTTTSRMTATIASSASIVCSGSSNSFEAGRPRRSAARCWRGWEDGDEKGRTIERS